MEDEIRMGHYELLYIVSGRYTEEEVGPIKEETKKIIIQAGAEISHEEDWGKRRFAYPIGQEHGGYYFLVQFSLPKEKLQEADRLLHLAKEVMRYQVVVIGDKSPEERAKEKAQKDARKEKLEEEMAAERKKQEEKAAPRKPKPAPAPVQQPIVKKEEGDEAKPEATDEEDKVKLEELDKKLDEILDTKDIV